MATPSPSNASATSVSVESKPKDVGGATNRTPLALAPVPLYVSTGVATAGASGLVLTVTG